MNSLAVAEEYYKAMSNKDRSGMGLWLHPDIHFIGPLAELKGKDSVLGSVQGILNIINRLSIRERFVSGNKVLFLYDLQCNPPIGELHVAAYLIITDNLISRIELFYDARPFGRV